MMEEHGHGAISIRIRMWMVDGVTMEVAPRRVVVVRKQECVNVQVRPVPVHPVLVAQHKHVTLVLVMWMVDGVTMEVAPRRVVVVHRQEHVHVQHPKEMVQHVLELRHEHVTRRVAVQMVDGVHLEIVVLLVEAECNHVYVDVQHNLEQEQTVLDLRGKPVTLKVVLLDLSMEDGASTPNAAQPAAEVRELVSANALYQQMVEMIVLVRPRIIIVIQIHVPSQEQPLHRMITRETMMSKHYSD